ncbi:MAG: FG-GAP repeat domain-containing protein [Phycisphaerales bacterium]
MHLAMPIGLTASIMLTAPVLAGDLPRSLNFENQSAARIVPTVAEGSSNEKEIEFGDIDLDGDMDMVVGVGSADFGERRNKVYRNDNGVFREVTASLIPEFMMTDVTRNAFIRDYDGDGFPDIYIINDSNSGGFAGNDHLYLSNFVNGKLVGYTEDGVARIPNGGDLGAACGGVTFDFDGDGDMDVYSGNYPGPSQDRGLYNNGLGFFSDVSSSMIPTDSDYTVDVALADMNGDGKMDLLVSNDFDPNFVYYNDKNDAGSGLGDFKYTGSVQNLGTAGTGENAMEPADFDGDGDLDVVWTNRSGTSGDRILRNDGNDASGAAILTTIDPFPSTVTGVRRKATVADFNGDGRPDMFLASQSAGRVVVLRNTSVEGGMSFVEWSPAPAFPNGSSLNGWHAAAFDTADDGDIDLVIGGFSGDHLFENVPANEVDEDDLTGGVLPSLWNSDPVAVRGRGMTGDSDEFMVADASNGFIAVVLNGPGDYRLELLDTDGLVMTSVDRGGLGVEEALQVSTNGARGIRVVMVDAGGGVCGPPDFNGDCSVDFLDLTALLAGWGCTDCITDIDGGGTGVTDLLSVLAAWGPVEGAGGDYQLEILGRN